MQVLFDLVLLLQDDDSDIRIHASTITSQIVLGLKNDLFEAKTLELLFQHLFTYYSNETDYPQCIEAIILGQKNMQALFDYELNSTKHIFELERSNIYKEELINIQIAAFYAKTTSQQLAPAIAKVHMMMKALSTLSQPITPSTPQIINEFTARPDIFTALYRSILWMNICIRNVSNLDELTITEIKSIYDQLKPIIPYMNPVLQDICQGCEPWSLTSSLQHQNIIPKEEPINKYGGLFLTSYY